MGSHVVENQIGYSVFAALIITSGGVYMKYKIYDFRKAMAARKDKKEQTARLEAELMNADLEREVSSYLSSVRE